MKGRQKFKIISTTADVGLTIFGKGLGEFYSNAWQGLNSLLFGDTEPCSGAHEPEKYCYRYHGDSRENVLNHFLSEILFLLYTRRKVTMGLDIKGAGEALLEADLLLKVMEKDPEIEIKSVTYHNLHIKDEDGFLSATVIFDV